MTRTYNGHVSERVAWLGGRLVPWSEAVVSIEDRGLQFAESLYEVLPVCGGRPRLITEHATRLRAGAVALGLDGGVPDDSDWERLSATLLRADPLDEGLLYAQVTGGTAPRRHLPEPAPEPSFFAYLQRYRFPRAPQVTAGMRVVTVPDERWGRCDLKTTMLLAAVLAKREAARWGAAEALLLSPAGEVHEGASSNVFALAGNVLTTPEQGPQLLPGTIRPVVERLATEQGLTVRPGRLTRAALDAADEVFVTSTTFLLMPVTAVDGLPVGDGRSGPVAAALASGLRRALGLED